MADGTSLPNLPASALRTKLEAAVEAAIAALDALDGDPDLEPSLAKFNASRALGDPPIDQDLEDEHDGREPDEDMEHALGWSEGAGWQYGSRTRAGSLGHGSDDREEACEDEGAITGDDEPDQDELCNWADEGDQSMLRSLPITPSRRPVTARSGLTNVYGCFPVRVLP